MAVVISGKELAKNLKEDMAKRVLEYREIYSRIPQLVVILVGEDPGSVSYVKGKEVASNEIGIKNTTFRLNDKVSESTLLDLIDNLNNDDTVDGILVQLPLPKHINEAKVISAVRHDKDVDGFHPLNVAGLFQKQKCILPCTPKGIIKLLESQNIEIAGKKAVVVGRSNIVGLPVAKLLLDKDATVTTAHSKTKDLASVTKEADILVVAVGRPNFIDGSMIKDGAVVIDVGVNRNLETNKLCGDVNFLSCEPKASYITKVPGGVGPMTICCLMENTIEAYLNHVINKEV